MISPYTRERIENWVGDFCHGDAPREFSTATRELASDILVRFLTAACNDGGTLEELSEANVRSALLGDVARLDLPAAVRAEVPGLCASLLSELERQGRLADGRALGAFARALGGAWTAATGPAKPYVRPGSELSRNDPCPCGSGKKYKKCCLRLLDK